MQDITKSKRYTDLLAEISISIMKRGFAILKERDLTCSPSPLQLKIFQFLYDSKSEYVIQKDLEENIKVSKATISGAITTMEKGGMIERFSIEKDGRSKGVRLTKAGIKHFKNMRDITEEVNRELIKGIPETKLKNFEIVLEKMKNNLDNKNINHNINN